MLRHGTQLGGSQRLGKRAWPERRRPAVAATWTRIVVVHLAAVLQLCVHCSFAVPGCVVPSGPVPRLLVAWTTASDRLKKDPGQDPQHDRGCHWPAVEATGAPSPGNNKPALYYRATEALAMTTCTSCTHTPLGKTHIYVLARLHPEHSCSFFPTLKHRFGNFLLPPLLLHHLSLRHSTRLCLVQIACACSWLLSQSPSPSLSRSP